MFELARDTKTVAHRDSMIDQEERDGAASKVFPSMDRLTRPSSADPAVRRMVDAEYHSKSYRKLTAADNTSNFSNT